MRSFLFHTNLMINYGIPTTHASPHQILYPGPRVIISVNDIVSSSPQTFTIYLTNLIMNFVLILIFETRANINLIICMR